MTIYFPPSMRGLSLRHVVFSTWTDHVPFAFDLVEAVRPDTFVELGTQAGMSYFAFCQALEQHDVRSQCWAVDTWAGDEHTGEYDDDVYRSVARHNEAHYATFSTLLRMRFEEAIHRFDDESLALLHIDGFHTYDAVRTDFETWFPKVAPGGIVIFHDIAARIHDFGAWKFWAELARAEESFAFRHGFGLGVVRKPGGSRPRSPLLDMMFSNDEATRAELRAFYAHASEHYNILRKAKVVERVKEKVKAQRRAENQST